VRRQAFALLLLSGAPALAQGLPHVPPKAAQVSVDLRQADARHSYLLAYCSERDDRPLFLEYALIAVERANGRWELDHVYRHPRDSPNPKWHLSVVFDAPVTPSRTYDHRPTAAEVDAFIHDSWFHFAPDVGFTLIKGEVYANTWERALDYRPTYRF
jgi:hypothetical protein